MRWIEGYGTSEELMKLLLLSREDLRRFADRPGDDESADDLCELTFSQYEPGVT
jgi:hypothetical protein